MTIRTDHTDDGSDFLSAAEYNELATAVLSAATDIDTANSNASTALTAASAAVTAANAKYTKPGSGIPSTDMTSAVVTSLGKADSALQSVPTNGVVTASITDANVTLAKLASTVQTSLGKADTALQSVTIADGSIVLAKLATAVQTSLGKADTALQSYTPGDGSIALAKLATGVQTSLGKADSALQAIASGSVNTAQLVDGSVTSAKVADGTIALGDLTTAVQASINAATRSFIRQHATRTLASSTSVQQLFDLAGSGAGAITLAAGTYRFTALISLSSMSATSGNSQFQFAGTAVFANCLMYTVGVDGGSALAATQTGSMATTPTNFPGSMQTAGTSVSQQAFITGTFEVTTGGTVIPSIQLATAAAAVLAAGSFFEVTRIGETTDVTVGAWA